MAAASAATSLKNVKEKKNHVKKKTSQAINGILSIEEEIHPLIFK